MVAPVTHVQEAQKLTADALVDLYEIQLKIEPVVYRFTNGASITWQGNLYEARACRLTGDKRTAETEESRPALQIFTPDSVFNLPAQDGWLNFATVIRKRVLRTHLEADTNIKQQRMYYVSRIREIIKGQYISLELRNMSEGPNVIIPARSYNPPEFPYVHL